MTASIAILGGGPIGLASALLLAQRGLASVVIEPRALAAAAGDRRLLALSQGSWQVLEPLLGAASLPRAPIESVHVSSAGDFGTTTLAAREFGMPALGATVRYGDLVCALEAAAGDSAHIGLRRGTRMTALAQRPASVSIELDCGSALVAALAVHAEGLGATATALGEEPARAAGWALLAQDIVLEQAAAGSAFERFTREGPLALLPAPPSAGARPPVWSLVWCATEDSCRRRLALDEAAFRAELQQMLGVRLARVVHAGERAIWPLTARSRAQLVEHRCVWIGNAAQTLHPVAGQGLNLGLRDAVVLRDALCAAAGPDAASADSVPAALALYQRQRRADRALIGAVTDRLPGLFATSALPVAWGRSLGLTALDLLPPLRREVGNLLMFGVRA